MALYLVTVETKVETYARSPEDAEKQALQAVSSDWQIAVARDTNIMEVEEIPQ